MPRGQEALARAFYGAALGLTEVDKPAELAGREGVWFRFVAGETVLAEIHLGVCQRGPILRLTSEFETRETDRALQPRDLRRRRRILRRPAAQIARRPSVPWVLRHARHAATCFIDGTIRPGQAWS